MRGGRVACWNVSRSVVHGVGDAGGPRATPWCVAERSVGCGPRPPTPDGDSSCRPGTSVDVTTAVRTEPKTESDVIARRIPSVRRDLVPMHVRT